MTGCNPRLPTFGALVRTGLEQAGFQFILRVSPATHLLCPTSELPRGAWQVTDVPLGGTVDPGPTAFSYLCAQIPSSANHYGGANAVRYCNPQLDPIMEAADRELNDIRRHALITQVYTQLNRDLVALPLYSVQAITAWRTDRVAGPVGLWNRAAYGTFWNMDYWYAPAR